MYLLPHLQNLKDTVLSPYLFFSFVHLPSPSIFFHCIKTPYCIGCAGVSRVEKDHVLTTSFHHCFPVQCSLISLSSITFLCSHDSTNVDLNRQTWYEKQSKRNQQWRGKVNRTRRCIIFSFPFQSSLSWQTNILAIYCCICWRILCNVTYKFIYPHIHLKMIVGKAIYYNK